MLLQLLLALRLIELTGPDGQMIELNPESVVAIRTPRASDHFGNEVKCFISTNDGRFFGVTQTCEEVSTLLLRGLI
jgi:hypothetical protein